MLIEYNNKDMEFFYSLKRDISWDTDISCIKNNNEISIALFNNTGISMKKRLEKEESAFNKNNGFKIILLANFFSNDKKHKNIQNYGSIELYNANCINQLVSIVENNESGYYVVE